jgi:hypothetical protein
MDPFYIVLAVFALASTVYLWRQFASGELDQED